MSWQDELLPASFRGIPFGVLSASMRPGRQTAIHGYPYRDQVWVEDLGRGPRPYRVTGFLVEGDVQSLGLPVFLQRDLLRRACEKQGTGILIHPSLGARTVSLIGGCEMTERADMGGAVELQFEFLETVKEPVYPTGAASTKAAVSLGAVSLDFSSIGGFASSVSAAIETGVAAVGSAIETVTAFAAPVLTAMQAVMRVVGAVTGVAGLVGRYAGGSRSTLQPATETTASLLAASTVSRTAVGAATDAAIAAAGQLGGPTQGTATANAASLGAAVQAMTEAVRAGCADPGTAITLLAPLAAFRVVPLAGGDAIGAAMRTVTSAACALCRQAALSSIARASAEYQPASQADAVAIRTKVSALIDAEILASVAGQGSGGVAGQGSAGVSRWNASGGSNATALALRGLRAAVAADLTARGQVLAPVVTVRTAASRPALAVAYSLYADASRYDELVARVDPVSPLFMPLTFEALAS